MSEETLTPDAAIDQLREDCGYDPDGDTGIDSLIAYKDALEDSYAELLAREAPETLWVEYRVPVIARVNFETREVERVITLDEEVRPTGSAFEDHNGAGEQVRGSLAARAVEIADSGEWPAWEAGF